MRRDRAALAPVGLLIATVAAVAFVGPGTATVTTGSANFTSVGNDSFANQVVDVTNGTWSLYVELDNDIVATPEPVEVAVFEADADGSETEVDRVQVFVADRTAELYESGVLGLTDISIYRAETLGTASVVDSPVFDARTVAAVSSDGDFLGGPPGSIGIGAATVVGTDSCFALKED